MFELRHYRTASGVDPFDELMKRLRDRIAVSMILARISRAVHGALGDCRSVGGGVWEMRMDFGPGYRVYYARSGRFVILLLIGGEKKHTAV